MRGLYSGLMQTYPVMSRAAEATTTALSHFRGACAIKLLYTDGAPGYQRSRAELNICHEVSTPGDSRSNGVIERTNLEVQIGTAASLLQAGLPSPFLDFRGAVLLPLGKYTHKRGCSFQVAQSLWG